MLRILISLSLALALVLPAYPGVADSSIMASAEPCITTTAAADDCLSICQASVPFAKAAKQAPGEPAGAFGAISALSVASPRPARGWIFSPVDASPGPPAYLSRLLL